MMTLLFSTRGRLNRGRFWGAGLGWAAVIGVLAGVGAALGGHAGDPSGSTAGPLALSLVSLVLSIAALWSGVCLGIKRYHDLDKSGAWVLIQLIPLVGSLWYLVEAGFIRGSEGANRFGPDPLGGMTSVANGSLPGVAA